MAKYNELQVGRFNRLAQKLLSLKGPASLDQLDNNLKLVLPLFWGAEGRYLEAWDLFGQDGTVAAPGAGNGATLTLRNPTGSNVIAVVYRIDVWETTVSNAIVTLFRPGTAGANAGDENSAISTIGWDGRGRSASTLILSNNTAAPVTRTGGVQVVQQRVSGGSLLNLFRTGDELPLSPGSLITLSAGTANEGMNWVLWWRERFLEDSERS
jgi:hypothetical protein